MGGEVKERRREGKGRLGRKEGTELWQGRAKGWGERMEGEGREEGLGSRGEGRELLGRQKEKRGKCWKGRVGEDGRSFEKEIWEVINKC